MAAYKPTLYVISGAGLSAESGIPTYRDAAGIWSQFDIDEVCNSLTWKRNRDKVFAFYRTLHDRYQDALPNPAHILLAEWQRKWGAERVRLLTQNVDLLLEAAGADKVTHLHGRMDELHCTACANRWKAEIDVTLRCPKCDSLKGVKPGIVMFYETAPEYIHLKKLNKALRPDDIVLFVGSSFELLSPEAMLPERHWGRERIVNVNPVKSTSPALGTHIDAVASEGLAGFAGQLAAWMGD